MGLYTEAGDWEFVGLTQVSLAAGFGGGVYFFKFRSHTARVCEDAFFFSGGLGVGVGAGQGVTLPDSSGRLAYSRIQCINTFSMANLDSSLGSLQSAGVSVLVGYSALYVAAFNLSNGVLFDNAGGFGLNGGGVQASANAFVGVWRVGTMMGRDMDRAVRGAFR